MRLTVPLFLLSSACTGHGQDCTAFADMAVTDPEGISDDEDLSGMDAAIDYLAEWTGLDGVCVPELRLVSRETMDAALPEDKKGAAGLYRGPGLPILVRDDFTSYHELCHAVDATLGQISLRRPDLFTEEPLEEFAGACSQGPQSQQLARTLSLVCGEDRVDPAEAFLQDDVFVGAGSGPALVGVVDSPFGDPVPVALGESPWDRFVEGVAGSGRYLHVLRQGDDVADEAGVDQILDPATGALVTTLNLPLYEDGEAWDALPGDDGALLVHLGRDADRAFWLSDADLSPVEVALPPVWMYFNTGFVRDGVLWLSAPAMADGLRWPIWSRTDLDSGETSWITEIDGTESWYASDDDGAALAMRTRAWHGWPESVVRFDGESFEPVMPLAWQIFQVSRLPDGKLLAAWSQGDYEDRLAGWLIGDETTQSWSLVEPDCSPVGGIDQRWMTQVSGRAFVLSWTQELGWGLMGLAAG